MRLMSVVIVLCGLASPAFAECETGAADCNADVLLHPLPGDDSGNESKKADDPSLYADPALAPSEDNGEVEAPTNSEEDYAGHRSVHAEPTAGIAIPVATWEVWA